MVRLRRRDHLPPVRPAALEALDRAIEEAGPGKVSTFFCEAISAAALPAYTPPARFWEGLAERRERHGFLVCFDEVVTGVGRTGRWFAGAATACPPDLIATAKGLGAGYAAIGAVLVKEHVYAAFADGSKRHVLGGMWRCCGRYGPNGPCIPGRPVSASVCIVGPWYACAGEITCHRSGSPRSTW